jgi:hypothetical protein
MFGLRAGRVKWFGPSSSSSGSLTNESRIDDGEVERVQGAIYDELGRGKLHANFVILRRRKNVRMNVGCSGQILVVIIEGTQNDIRTI